MSNLRYQDEVGDANNVKGWFQRRDDEVYYTEPVKRPISITIVCGVITLALMFNFLQIATTKNTPSTSILFWVVFWGQMGLVVASLVGLWNMKKWGAYLYTLNVVINTGLLLMAGRIALLALIVPVILLSLIYWKIKEME